jgi:hypothetical protein
MCTFVTATLPARADMRSLEPIFQKYGFTIEPLDGAVAMRNIGTGEAYFRLASGYCCDASILGGLSIDVQHNTAQAREKKLTELKKAGWGEARINRWLQETEKNSGASKEGDAQQVKRWQEFIRDVLAQRLIDHLGLIVHDYDGSLMTADLPVGKPQRVLLKNLNKDIFENMKDGMLYRFVNSEF